MKGMGTWREFWEVWKKWGLGEGKVVNDLNTCISISKISIRTLHIHCQYLPSWWLEYTLLSMSKLENIGWSLYQTKWRCNRFRPFISMENVNNKFSHTQNISSVNITILTNSHSCNMNVMVIANMHYYWTLL